MYLTGIDKTLSVIRDMGDKNYCTNGQEVNAGLSSAIGGCTTNQVDHVNAFATIARMGVYKPTATVLEVKNSQGQIIKQWKDSSKQVLDPQIAYQLADIMSDQNARLPAFGVGGSTGFLPNKPDGVRIAGKTGTSNDGVTGYPKDLWFMSYSPKASFGVWVGNHDSKAASPTAYSTVLGSVNAGVMHDTHANIFAKDGSWKANDWFSVPAGLQKLTVSGKTDWFPSWFNKAKATTGEKMVFDTVSKKKATDCTPAAAKVEISVQTMTDAATKQKIYLTTDGYDPNATDDVHQCGDVKPFVNSVNVSKSSGKYAINVSVTQGTHALQIINITVGGAAAGSISVSGSGNYSLNYTPTANGMQTVSATVTDTALYTSDPPVSTSYNFN
jgi:membrane peptidoglycan carboxypeptidase